MANSESRLWRRSTLVYAGLVALLSLLPDGPQQGPLFFQGEDKVVHVGMYGLLALMLTLSSREAAFMHGRMLPLYQIGLLCWGYGFLMELAQRQLFWLGRDFSCADLAANGVGALAGLGAVLFIRRTRFGCSLRPPADGDTAGLPGS